MKRPLHAVAIVAVVLAGMATSGSLGLRAARRAVRLVAGVAGPLDPSLAPFVADQPNAHVLRAIATDIDDDGDLDVVASTTDAAVAVWINDGAGHYTRESPAKTSRLIGTRGLVPAVPVETAQGLTSTGHLHAIVLTRAFLSPIVTARLQLASATSRPSGRGTPDRPTRAPPSRAI